MKRLWELLASSGLPPDLPEFEVKRVRLINLFSLFWSVFCVAIVLGCVFLINRTEALGVGLVILAILIAPLILVRMGHRNAAKAFFIGQFVPIGACMALLYGEVTRFEWSILVLPASAYILFDRPRHVLFLGIGYGSFLLYKWIYATFPPVYSQPEDFWFYEPGIAFAVCLYTYYLVSVFKTETERSERQVAEKNQALTESQKLIEAQNESLLAANLALDRKQNALESLNQELQQFASLASHDMKEPLRTISSFATLLNRRMTDDDNNRDLLRFIEDAAKRMNSMLEDLIHYARAGVEKSAPAPVDLEAVLDTVRMNLFQQLQQKNGSIEAGRLPVVIGHATLMTQLFQNIIGNAVKYTRPDVPPLVKVRAILQDGELLFIFRDNGIGIPEESIGKIFEPFRRLHTRTEFEGSGIGLATCKKIVDAYGGQIWAESKVGEGTVFFVKMPGHLLAQSSGEAAERPMHEEVAVFNY